MTEELKVELSASLEKFSQQMDSAMGKVKEVGQKMEAVGKKMTLAISAPLALIGGKALANFDKQIQAENKLAAAVAATGRNAREELAAFKEFASGLQEITTVGDEATLELLSVATSMGLNHDKAKLAAKEAIALSKAMGMSEKSAIRYTAALADGDTTMLNRYIPALRAIENDAERAAKAHELLADMFGAATAEAQSGLGPLKQLQNQFGDLLEEFGAIIADGLNPIIDRVKKVVNWFQSLDKGVKKQIVTWGAFAAGIGPVLLAIGFFATTILPAMVAGFAALTSPITLVIAAVAALAAAVLYIWDNWAAIKERISDIGWWRNALLDMVAFLIEYNPLQLLIKPFEYLLDLLGMEMPNPFDGVQEAIQRLKVDTKEYQHEFGSFTQALKNGASSAMEAMGMVSSKSEEAGDKLSGAAEDAKNLGNALRSIPKIEIVSEGELAALEEGQEMLSLTNEEMNKMYAKADKEFFNMENFQQWKDGMEEAKNQASQMQAVFDHLTNTIGQGLTNAFQQMLNGAKKPFEAFGKLIKDLITRLIAAAVAAAILSAIMPAIFGKGSMEIPKFGQMFTSFAGLPQFADGGIVSGPVIGMMGEYSGVKTNPEVIAPLDKLKSMIGDSPVGSIEVHGIIKGEDIYLSNKRATNTRKRIT